jgi:predicted ArsR family transcriptional regulator
MERRRVDERMAAVAALGDRLRRGLYRYVVSQDRPVGRDEAAQATGVSRSTAAFHLDRLADEGLLTTEFRRLGGRRGPGAGRPSKLYRRAEEEIVLSLPPRHYDLAADLLARAVSDAAASGEPVGPALQRVARQRGAALAAAALAAEDGPSSTAGTPAGAVRASVDALADLGYEPQVREEEVVLVNCPFHALVDEHRRLVCGMNLALLEGFAAAVPGLAMEARLQPDDRLCCVRLAPTAAAESRPT